MKVTDYIVEFLISKNITDVFGYPGGVICHFMDSLSKYPDKIQGHLTYHEQGAAFAACGYAQESGKVGVAYATSGPGATNLVTGIANAYFDSTPAIFFTGQVDTYGLKGELPIRQRGFQETDMVSIVDSITKFSVRIDNPQDIRYYLEKAYYEASHGNPGPVLLDLPADVQRAEVEVAALREYEEPVEVYDVDEAVSIISNALKSAKRPCLILGNGIKQSGTVLAYKNIIEKRNIPTVFSMPAFDILPYNHKQNFGFIGANGHRYANFVLGKSDLIIALGSRMDLKQVGNNRAEFASQASIIRVDVDKGNFSYKVHEDETQIFCDIKVLATELTKKIDTLPAVDEVWVDVCTKIKNKLSGYDDESYLKLLEKFSEAIPSDSSITLDVGQSEVWCAQKLRIKDGQRVHLSGGHGAMGFSLPAAIGTYYANHKHVFSFNGDGGIQMNIQELQYLKREKIPITVVVINNHALGMIRGFQEANFNCNYYHTLDGGGYQTPDFEKMAAAYDMTYRRISNIEECENLSFEESPSIVELALPKFTYLNPNFGRNGLIQDQRPYIDREIFMELMNL